MRFKRRIEFQGTLSETIEVESPRLWPHACREERACCLTCNCGNPPWLILAGCFRRVPSFFSGTCAFLGEHCTIGKAARESSATKSGCSAATKSYQWPEIILLGAIFSHIRLLQAPELEGAWRMKAGCSRDRLQTTWLLLFDAQSRT